MLRAIQHADLEKLKTLEKKANQILEKDTIDLMKRVEGNSLRSHKNLMLSHNSMYALVAERGGLDATLAHYMSEKYAVIIEMSRIREELSAVHSEFIREYANPKYRLTFNEDKSLSSKAMHIISNNFMNDLSIQFIAEELYVTKEHLMRTFKEETDKTINEVIQRNRLEEAIKLLAHSNFSVTDIAMMVGFNSSQYFSRVFKKEYNQIPSEYRLTLNP